jgi:hypothetical protein
MPPHVMVTDAHLASVRMQGRGSALSRCGWRTLDQGQGGRLGRRCQLGSDIRMLGVDDADQIGVEEEVWGHDNRWDPVMQHPMRSGVDVLGDGGAEQIGVNVGDADQISSDEEDLQSCNIK